MKIRTAVLIGSRSFWQFGKKSRTANHLKGAVIGIALSLIPLVVVMVVANGMIEGITYRLIEVFTYHLQLPLPDAREVDSGIIRQITDLPSVSHAHIEKSGFALVKVESRSSGATIRAVSPDFLEGDQGFRDNFHLISGALYLEPIPLFIKEDIFKTKILNRISKEGDRALLLSCYTPVQDGTGYKLIDNPDEDKESGLVTVFQDLEYSSAIIGEALADKIGAGTGDRIFLWSFMNAHGRMFPKPSKFIISGIFSTGYQDVDRFLLYLPLDIGVKILPAADSREYIGIKVTDPFTGLHQTASNVISILKQNRVSYGEIKTWDEMQKYQFQSFKSTKASLIFIMCVIILVAAVNVYSSIHMLVMGKIREIAIMKSMGTKPGTITFSFVFTGFLTGLAGTLSGILIGLLLAVNINEIMNFIERIINLGISLFNTLFFPGLAGESLKSFKILNPDFYLENIPIIISFQEVSFIAVFSIIVSIVASYLPARSAGRVRPLEIIRRY